MIGTSLFEYLQIRAAIGLFRGITPVSFIYLATAAFYRAPLGSPWLAGYAGLEAAFYLLVYLPRRKHLQKASQHAPPPLPRKEREELMARCASHVSEDMFPTGWFLSNGTIRRENVVDWILWALFSCDRKQNADPEWEEEIDGYVDVVEKMIGRTLEEGENPNVQSMRLTFDPVLMQHRPFIWYMIVMGVDAYTCFALWTVNFKHYAPTAPFRIFPPRPLTILSRKAVGEDMPYWYRPHKSTTKLPIVFIHGIGIGLWPYIRFFRELATQDPDVGVVVIELMPICMHMTPPLLPRVATCEAIAAILDSLNLDQVVVASHSYGTVVTAHMLHSPELSPRIVATLFIDPIPFLLHLPNVAYNFLYREPKEANEHQLHFFASRDPDISRALSRHFHWPENVLWKDELDGRKVAVSVSGADQIVHSKEIRKYLTDDTEVDPVDEGKDVVIWNKPNWEVLYYRGLDHAMVFDSRKRRQPLLDILHRFVRAPNYGSADN